MRYERASSAGVIVFNRDRGACEFLLLLSRLTRRPLWEFPKGGINEGETVLQAAMRELQEETGLSADDVRMVSGFEGRENYRFSVDEGGERVLIRKRVTYFLAESTRREIRLSTAETSRHAWLGVREARRRLRYRERREMLDRAAEAAGCAGAGG